MKKALLVLAVLAIMMVSTAAAQLSVQLKRTNPGIAKEKQAELIFDIVNTNINHKVEGFLWCRSPDDAVVSSTYGVGSGSGAQYVSPKFQMDVGPSQQAMTITVGADTPGDKSTGCYVKYIPYKIVTTKTTKVTPGVNGSEPTSEEVSEESRQYLKLNGNYVSQEALQDGDYSQIRLDKSVPFVAAGAKEPACPEGKSSCTAGEVVDLGAAGKLPVAWIIIGVLIVVLLVVYLLGKSSRS